jgi:hypothetical protein
LVEDWLRIDGLVEGIHWLAACEKQKLLLRQLERGLLLNKVAAAAAAAGCCVSASLSTETLKENMGQYKSKERNFKEQKKRKTFEVRF